MDAFMIYPAMNTKGPVTYYTEVCTEEKQLVPKESQEAYWLPTPSPPRRGTDPGLPGAVSAWLDRCFPLECIVCLIQSIAWFQMKGGHVKTL